jgi:DNA-binding NarL/FixJ family response regulator
MSIEGHDEFCDWEWFTFARARILRELADGRTEVQAAARLGISYQSVRSQVEDLKAKTGLTDVREMGRWWRKDRVAWLAWCERQAGIVEEEGDAS